MPYLGYGTPQRLTLCGRVLKDEGLRPAAATDSRWRNLYSFYERIESDEVPHARVRAGFLGKQVECVADKEGYFSVSLNTRGRLGPGLWQEVALELVDPPAGVRATGHVLVPSTRAKFGVISDIDDTVVYSNVTHRLRMVLTAVLSNARTRKPFKGVAAFYRALHAGANPVFYVSKSPWNLYAPLVEFLEVQDIPCGPLILRDFGSGHGAEHKRKSIARILATYPKLEFVLIGDSGERDPEIYSEVVRAHPERIRVIYIRSVTQDPKRIVAIEKLIAQVRPTGCQLVLTPDSEFAAAHAAGEGLIQASRLRAVRADKLADENSPSKPAASSGALK
jgi:phosphatidate phosphatase APP1